MDSNNGYSALFQARNSAQQSKENLATAQRISTFVDGKRKEEQEAQAKVAAMNAEIEKRTSELLGYDRKRINELKRNSFQTLKEGIAAAGGDYSTFMSNGGLLEMENYKNSIVNSDAFIDYQENQKNMKLLLQLEATGKGYLINAIDKANMDNYRKNKGGKITYTGQLMDIEIPEGKDYDWNTMAPAYDILRHKGNYAKILANFEMNYPTIEANDQNLLNYVRETYAVRGTNYQRGQQERQFQANENQRAIQNDLAYKGYDLQLAEFKAKEDQRAIDNQYKAAEFETQTSELQLKLMQAGLVDSSTGGAGGVGTDVETFSSNVAHLQSTVDNRNISAAEWYQGTPWKKMDLPESQGGFGQRSSELGYKPNTLKSAAYGTFNAGSKIGLANSRIIGNLDSQAAAIAALGKTFTVEGGKVKGVNLSDVDWFDTTGKNIKNNGTLVNWMGKTKTRDLKIQGVVSAAGFINSSGQMELLTDKYNWDGKTIDKSHRNSIQNRIKGGKTDVKMVNVVALEDDRGALFYVPLDLSNSKVRTAYTSADPNDKISGARKSYASAQAKQTQSDLLISKKGQVERNAYMGFLNDQKANEAIRSQSALYGNPGNPQQRSMLLLSYYATLAGEAQDVSIYSQAASQNGFREVHELDPTALKSPHDDYRVIRMYQAKDQANSSFYNKWMNNYQNLNKMK